MVHKMPIFVSTSVLKVLSDQASILGKRGGFIKVCDVNSLLA